MLAVYLMRSCQPASTIVPSASGQSKKNSSAGPRVFSVRTSWVKWPSVGLSAAGSVADQALVAVLDHSRTRTRIVAVPVAGMRE